MQHGGYIFEVDLMPKLALHLKIPNKLTQGHLRWIGNKPLGDRVSILDGCEVCLCTIIILSSPHWTARYPTSTYYNHDPTPCNNRCWTMCTCESMMIITNNNGIEEPTRGFQDYNASRIFYVWWVCQGKGIFVYLNYYLGQCHCRQYHWY